MLSLNKPNFGDYLDFIYPSELEMKDTTDNDYSASDLDEHDQTHKLSVKL